MKLYQNPVSPYCRKVLVALAHRGDDVAVQLLDPRVDLRADWYTALSPFGKMPTLELDDGTALIESTTIIEYLECVVGPRVLLPRDPRAAFVARRFDRLGDLYLVDAQTDIWFRPGTDEARRGYDRALAAWELFAAQLADGRPFVAGDVFTLGDLSGAIATDYLVRLGVDPDDTVGDWMGRCFGVPAMAVALEQARPMMEGMLAARAERLMG
jgi:glutathione S-transferase